MDPVSVVGLVAALCHLIQASNQLVQIAKDLKEGDRDLLDLCNDILFFEEALKGFERVLRSRQSNHSISSSVIGKAIEESSSTIQELNSRLCPIVQSEKSSVRRMRWLQNKSAVKKLHERVKTQSGMLQSFLALAHSETFLNACNHYPELHRVSNVTDGESGRESVTLTDHDISEKSSITSAVSQTWSSSHHSIDTVPSPVDDFGTSLQKTASAPSTNSDLARCTSSSTKPFLIRKACRFDCDCSCHPITELEGDGMLSLSKSFSKLDVSSSRCDNPNCLSDKYSNQTSASKSRLFRNILSQVSSAHSVKVRYHMNTFHLVPESADSLRYTKQGNLDGLRAAIQSGRATLWDTAPDGWSLLHTAAYNRQLPIVEYLLKLGASTEVSDVGARKPADLALMNSLLSGATQAEHDINKAFAHKDDYLSGFDFTPVHIAVLDLYQSSDFERPSLEQILGLVDDCNNAPPGTDWSKWKSKYKKRSPLFRDVLEYYRASAYEQPKTHKVIHNLIDQKDKSLCWTPLHWACSTGKRDKIQILMYHGTDPTILSNLRANILHAAAESKALGGLEDALNIWRRYADKIDINQPNYWRETPLHVAAWGSLHNVKLLVEAGAERNVRQEDDQVPLHYTGMTARGNVRLRIIDLLCARNDPGHINAQDTDGRPPIFDFLDDAKCVEALIKYGASIELLDGAGRSAFHYACVEDYDETLETLLRLSKPGSVMATVKDHEGNSALNLALSNGSRHCALVLLKLDDIGDIVGHNGWTIVHHAAKLGDYDVLEAVLNHRSCVQGLRTADGKTAEVVAMEAGTWQGELKDLLRRYNAVA